MGSTEVQWQIFALTQKHSQEATDVLYIKYGKSYVFD